MALEDYKVNVLVRTKEFALAVISLISKFPKNNQTFEVISKQLLRSATSIGANLVEAQASSSRRDFKNFIGYALKSANETVYWLELLRDSGKVKGAWLDEVIREAQELAKILGASMLKLKQKG